MRFEILGPPQVLDHGLPVRVGGPRERRLLVALLLRQGRLSTRAYLTTALWDEVPPTTSRPQIANAIAALRRHLPTLRIQAIGDGYRLDLDHHELDLLEFTTLLTTVHHATDPTVAEEACRAALDLWRGPALDGLPGDRLRDEIRALETEHLACLEHRIELDLDRGRHGHVLGELAQLTRDHPLRERLIILHLKALTLAGQRVGALAIYDEFRRMMADELGLDPSPELQKIHLDLLRAEKAPSPTQPRIGTGTAPRQLPAAVPRFVGRTAVREELDNLLGDGPRIVVISGTPGVGKTALAVHWAHQVTTHFPDGQLYANLHGYHPTEAPMSPQTVIRRFLDALHQGGYDVPVDPSAQTDLYRSLMSQRRVLVVLDNARTAEQVRPLLPGSSGSLVVVTSRDALTGLVATEGAHLINLDLLTVDEATDLLASRIGLARTTAEPETVREIVTRCARLPLPLVAVAASAATRPTFPLSALANHLQSDAKTFDTTNVDAAFSWSYRALRPDTARAFRLLGLHDAPDLGLAGVASLVGCPVGEVLPILADLTTANLMTEHVPERYQWHDLLHAYAQELALTTDPSETRTDAQRRLFDHYLYTANTAAHRLNPVRDRVPFAPLSPQVTIASLPDRRTAMMWFDAEYPSLLVAIRQAVETGFNTHAWQMAVTLADYSQRRGYWQDWEAAHQVALTAAERTSDLLGAVIAHRGLARVKHRLGQVDQAQNHLKEAMGGAVLLDDVLSQAITLLDLARFWLIEDNTSAGLDQATQAIERFSNADHPIGAARALNTLGRIRARRSEYSDAVAACSQALAIHEESGYPDLDGTAETLDTLGYVQQRSGDLSQAVATYKRAINLYRQVGADRMEEAATLRRLGECSAAMGDLEAARIAWKEELDILVELNHPDITVRPMDHPIESPPKQGSHRKMG